jgi:hypothetical protein
VRCRSHLGGLTSTGVVTDSTPNVRFADEEPWPIADRAGAVPAAMVEWFERIGMPLTEVRRDLEPTAPPTRIGGSSTDRHPHAADGPAPRPD